MKIQKSNNNKNNCSSQNDQWSRSQNPLNKIGKGYLVNVYASHAHLQTHMHTHTHIQIQIHPCVFVYEIIPTKFPNAAADTSAAAAQTLGAGAASIICSPSRATMWHFCSFHSTFVCVCVYVSTSYASICYIVIWAWSIAWLVCTPSLLSGFTKRNKKGLNGCAITFRGDFHNLRSSAGFMLSQ